jgi:hypothetical protein
MPNPSPIENAVKLIGESVVTPGASQWLDGNIRSGAVYLLVGVAARMLLGPIGPVLVAIDSYSESVSEKHLHEHILGG